MLSFGKCVSNERMHEVTRPTIHTHIKSADADQKFAVMSPMCVLSACPYLSTLD